MSQFLPENAQGQQASSIPTITPESPQTTQEDVALMQRVFSAAMLNPSQIPDQFMAYLLDWIQTQRLIIPIGQVFGYQRIAPQVITDFGQVPNPADGQIILLKVGSSAPYTYVQMMYDQGTQQWASEQFSFAAATQTSNLGSPEVKTYASAMSWSPVHLGGLTMQLRWAGSLNNNGTAVAHAGVSLVWAQLSGGGYTSSTVMDANNPTGGTTVAVGVDWTTISDPGNYDVVVGGMYSYVSVTGGGNTSGITGGCVGRFVK